MCQFWFFSANCNVLTVVLLHSIWHFLLYIPFGFAKIQIKKQQKRRQAMKFSAKILSFVMVLMMAFGALSIFAMMPHEAHAANGEWKLVTDASTL